MPGPQLEAVSGLGNVALLKEVHHGVGGGVDLRFPNTCASSHLPFCFLSVDRDVSTCLFAQLPQCHACLLSAPQDSETLIYTSAALRPNTSFSL